MTRAGSANTFSIIRSDHISKTCDCSGSGQSKARVRGAYCVPTMRIRDAYCLHVVRTSYT